MTRSSPLQTVLRLARPADARGILGIYAPVVRHTATSFEITPPDVPEMERRVQQTLTRYPWLVCAAGDQILGYAYASSHRSRAAYRWAVEVSVYVHPNHRRQGLARALYEALFRVLGYQGFARALAGVALPNPESTALHEALGFAPVGVYHHVGCKLGQWWDVAWWERSLAEQSASAPREPVPLAEIFNEVARTVRSP